LGRLWSNLQTFSRFRDKESILEAQPFASAQEVTAKAMRALTRDGLNGLEKSFQKLYEHWQKVTAQRNCFEVIKK
jgi:hypothetical protein